MATEAAEMDMRDHAIEIVAAMLNDRFGKWVPWARLSDEGKAEQRRHAADIIEALLGDTDRAGDLDPACVDFVPSWFGLESGVGIGFDWRPSTYKGEAALR